MPYGSWFDASFRRHGYFLAGDFRSSAPSVLQVFTSSSSISWDTIPPIIMSSRYRFSSRLFGVEKMFLTRADLTPAQRNDVDFSQVTTSLDNSPNHRTAGNRIATRIPRTQMALRLLVHSELIPPATEVQANIAQLHQTRKDNTAMRSCPQWRVKTKMKRPAY
jgi:hypothetical protein